MLGWLVSAVAPWLIHLWHRRRYRRTSWAAMEYLLAALRETRRRLRLEEWTLLAIRTGLIVLVVLALAEPFHTPQVLTRLTGQRVHRILVLDASLSMGTKQEDKTRWERVKELAAELITRSPPCDGFSLILMAEPPQVVVGVPVFDRQELLRELEELQLHHTSADLPATFGCVEQVLQSAVHHVPRLDMAEVYFLSDLCRVGWQPEFANAEVQSTLEQRLSRIARQTRLVIVDVGQADVPNVAVTDVRLLEPYSAAGQTLHIEAVLKSFGQDRPEQPVELWVNGQLVKRATVELPAGKATPVVLPCLVESPGEYTLEVRIEGDHLPIDNRRFAVRKVKPVIRVLCVDGRPSGGTFQGAADFLAIALQPGTESTPKLPLQPEVAPESALLERNLNDYDCTFLCNVGQLTRSEVRLLENYLQVGGGLVFFLGDRVQAEAYNRLMGGEQKESPRILPARLGPLVSQTVGRLNPLEYRHPIVAAFRGRERAGLLTTPIFQYVRLHVPEGSQAQVVLALANGDPLIVEEPIFQGRVVLVATSADTTWTALPVWPSYVPLVQEITAWAISGLRRQEQVRVGEAIGAAMPAPKEIPRIRLTPAQGPRVELRPRLEWDSVVWSYAETFWSGFYLVEYGPPLGQEESYAVNPDIRESDLTKLSAEQLQEIWGPGISFVYETTVQPTDLSTPRVGLPPPQRLTQVLLHAAVGLMVLETLLAWRMGNRGK